MRIDSLTIPRLKQMMAAIDDEKGHHILWVSKAGDVHITRLPGVLSPVGWFMQNQDRVLFRLETFSCGNGYMGPTAAVDEKWVKRLYKALLKNWETPRGTYVDFF